MPTEPSALSADGAPRLGGRLRPDPRIAIVLAVVTLLVYARVCGFDFLDYDDHTNVYANPHLNPVSWSSLVFFWRHTYFALYMPVTYTVWLALATLAGLPHAVADPATGLYTLNPHVFHTANLCLQVLDVLLVYALLRCFVKRNWAAAAGALLFGIHPMQVEPVAWVTGMNNLLSGAFVFVALRQYTLFARAHAEGLNTQQQRWHYGWATMAFAMALLAKPIAVTVPAMAWAIDRWMVGRSARACTRSVLSWVGLAVLCVVVTKSAQSSHGMVQTPILLRPFVAGDALDFYLFKLFLPLNLCPHYGRTPGWLLAQSWRYYTVIPPLLLGAAIWSRRMRHPCLLTAACIFVLGLLPVLGLVPHYFQFSSTVADRYLYLALMGPALLLACLLDRPRPLADGAAAIGLLLLALMSWRQVGYWRDTRSIFEHTLVANPQSWAAYVTLGGVLDREGHPDQAIADYKESLRLRPTQSDAQNNLGTIYLRRMQLDAAQACFLAAIATDPLDELSRVNLGTVYRDRGQNRKAVEQYLAVLRDNPDSESANYNLALALMKQGNKREAARRLQLVLANDPHNAPAHINLANLLDELGQTDLAQSHYLQAIELTPDSPEANTNYGLFLSHHGQAASALPYLATAVKLGPRDPQSHYNLGRALGQQQRLRDAATEFSTAIALNPRYVEAYFNLGIAHMMAGHTSQAIAQWRRALAIDPSYAPARQALIAATETQAPGHFASQGAARP